VTTYILTKEKLTLFYKVDGITGIPLTQFHIHNFNYYAVSFFPCGSVLKSVLFNTSTSLTGMQWKYASANISRPSKA